MKRLNIITMGEALIDFIPAEKGIGLKDVSAFYKKPGGAPANVAACVAKLGGQARFIGKLGNDAFGEFIIETLNQCGVDTTGIVRTNEANTALAFVSLDASGNRDFSFYRNPSADMLYDEKEVLEDYFDDNTILHFCSVSLIDAPVKKAHIKAIELVKKKQGIISFDPNVRLPLWPDEEMCRDTILQFLPYADVLKLSDEELQFITGIQDEDKGARLVLNRYNPRILLLTKGPKGSTAYYGDNKIEAEPLKVKVVDTTGAGDAFIGSFLYQIGKGSVDLNQINNASIYQALLFSNKAGAITTASKGAIEALPTLMDMERFFE